jgi:hypothetical protein
VAKRHIWITRPVMYARARTFFRRLATSNHPQLLDHASRVKHVDACRWQP